MVEFSLNYCVVMEENWMTKKNKGGRGGGGGGEGGGSVGGEGRQG